MHEMGIVISFVKTAQDYAARSNAARVVRVVLQLGEISGIEGRYLSEFYPAVVEGTLLEGSELVIETIEAGVFCTDCANTYNPMKSAMKCPSCGSERCDVIEGRSLLIKEIDIEQAGMPSSSTAEERNG